MSDYLQIMEKHAKNNTGVCKVFAGCLLVRYPNSVNSYLPQIPTIAKQNIKIEGLDYLGFDRCRQKEYDISRKDKTVGFFLPDAKFERVCLRPWSYVDTLAQYEQVLSPDLSCYTDMSLEEQWVNTYWSRFVGKFWQICGLTVAPTVSWGSESSFEFCFSGIAKGSVVALSTNGTGKTRMRFMAGFKELCARIEPQCVICYCPPYPEMYNYAKILALEHEGNRARRLARLRPMPGQLLFGFDTGKIFEGGI